MDAAAGADLGAGRLDAARGAGELAGVSNPGSGSVRSVIRASEWSPIVKLRLEGRLGEIEEAGLHGSFMRVPRDEHAIPDRIDGDVHVPFHVALQAEVLDL